MNHQPLVGSLYLTDVLLVVLITVCGITDLVKNRIYNAVTYPSLGLALLAQALQGGPASMSLESAVLGGFVGFSLLFVIYLMKGVGGGDVKLLTVIGTLKGTFFVLNTLFYSLILGSLFGIIAAAFSGELRGILKRVFYTLFNSVLPGMGPISHVTPNGPKVNFGLAICVATWLTLLGELGKGFLIL